MAKSSSKSSTSKRAHRFKSGTVAAREVVEYQRNADLLLKRTSFGRVAREIAQKSTGSGQTPLRFSKKSLGALQEAVEAHTVKILEGANLIALRRVANAKKRTAKTVTCEVGDLETYLQVSS